MERESSALGGLWLLWALVRFDRLENRERYDAAHDDGDSGGDVEGRRVVHDWLKVLNEKVEPGGVAAAHSGWGGVRYYGIMTVLEPPCY